MSLKNVVNDAPNSPPETLQNRKSGKNTNRATDANERFLENVLEASSILNTRDASRPDRSATLNDTIKNWTNKSLLKRSDLSSHCLVLSSFVVQDGNTVKVVKKIRNTQMVGT